MTPALAQNEPQPDFVLDSPNDHGMEGLMCLFGIENSSLTSSLAIGAEVVERLRTGD